MNTTEHSIAFVEFHDARIERVGLSPGGAGIIEFSSVCAYREVSKSPDYEVWSYKGLLALEGVESLCLEGSICTEDYISNCYILGEQGSPHESILHSETISIREIRIEFGSGTVLQARAARATFNLLEPIKLLDRWEGPLRGG